MAERSSMDLKIYEKRKRMMTDVIQECNDYQKNFVPRVCLKETAQIPYIATTMNSPAVISEMMYNLYEIDSLTDEYAYVIGINGNCDVVGIMELSHGSINQTMLPIRELYQSLLLMDAASFVIVHNHPSGNTKPSGTDVEIVKKLESTSTLMGIKFLDFIILGNNDYYSYAETTQK